MNSKNSPENGVGTGKVQKNGLTDHELRVLIATKIHGCEIIRDTAGYDNWIETPGCGIVTWDDGEEPPEYQWTERWCPLTDLNAAMEAVEKFCGIGSGEPRATPDIRYRHRWWVQLLFRGGVHEGMDDSLPRAICLALAEAVKEKV